MQKGGGGDIIVVVVIGDVVHRSGIIIGDEVGDSR